ANRPVAACLLAPPRATGTQQISPRCPAPLCKDGSMHLRSFWRTHWLIAAVFSMLAAIVASPGPASAWVTQLNGTASAPSDSLQPNDVALSVAVDPSGNVIAGGRLNNLTTGLDFTVAKFSGSTGAELWRQNLNGTDGGFERVLSVAVNAAGDVFAAGRI